MKTTRLYKVSFLVIVFACVLSISSSLQADPLYSKNKKANALYDKGKYDDAQKEYDNLILEYPAEEKLKGNKGAAEYKLGAFDKAEESFNAASVTKDKKALADIYYNLGNTQYMEADRMAGSGDQKAMDKYKAAFENYIKALDARPNDKDTKWNAQLVQKKIKQMEQQQKQQQNNKDNKDNKQNQDKNKQDNKDNKDKKDQNKDQQKKDNKDDQKKDDQNKDQNQDKNQDNKNNQDKQKPEPSPQEQKQSDMKKEEAKRLLEQFSDDDKDLNKKPKKVGVYREKNVEKDW